MAKRKDPRREELRDQSGSKETYFFVNPDEDVEVRSKVVDTISGEVIHYPFNRDGSRKYDSKFRCFRFKGFNVGETLPVGIQKSPKFGYGFTKDLAPLMEVFSSQHKVLEVHVNKKGGAKLTKDVLTLGVDTLKSLLPVFTNLAAIQRKDRQSCAASELANLFPKEISAIPRTYTKNSIHLAIEPWDKSISSLSSHDKTAIRDLLELALLSDELLPHDAIATSKQKIDQRHLEDFIAQCKKLLAQSNETPTLEKKWQTLLADHSWVFSYIFAFPVILSQKEAYVGGKNISNKDGKVTDFLIKNSLTSNVAFLEIKTHKTILIAGKKPYRGTDVFPMSKDLSGGISQVLDQRDNFQKTFYNLRYKSEEEIESINSQCVVLMGSVKDLSRPELHSFEMFRSNSKDVLIMTFDELLERAESLKKLAS